MNPDPRYPTGQPGYPPGQYPAQYPPPGYPTPGYPTQPGYPTPPAYPPGAYPAQPAYPPAAYPQQPGNPGYPTPPQYPAPGYPPPSYPPPGYPSQAQYPAAPAPPPARRSPGWWRRNWWALPVLVPLFAAAVGYNIVDGYDKWTKFLPTEAVNGLHGQWVTYGDARLRLLSLTELHNVKDHAGQPLALPSTVDVWQAKLGVDAPDDSLIGACHILLQDAAGATYSADPDELFGADIDTDYGCIRPFEGPETGPFTITATFVTTTNDIRGVRVTLGTQLPRYAWLTPPG